jgi:hypothetical protein
MRNVFAEIGFLAGRPETSTHPGGAERRPAHRPKPDDPQQERTASPPNGRRSRLRLTVEVTMRL